MSDGSDRSETPDASRPPAPPQGYQQPGYQQQGYPQGYAAPAYPPQYGQPPVQYTAVTYANYAPPEPRGLSITSLVLGIVSLFFGFTFLVPIGAIVLGAIGLKKEPTGRGMSITGIILGGVCMLGWALLVILWLVFIIGTIGVATTYGTTPGTGA